MSQELSDQPPANKTAPPTNPAPTPRPRPQPGARRVVKRPTAPAPLPEGMRYLGSGARFMASLIDSVLVLAVIIPLVMLVNGSSSARTFIEPYLESFEYLGSVWEAMGELSQGEDPLLPTIPKQPGLLDTLIKVALPAAAFLIFWRYRSATPGKMIFKAQIVDATHYGRPTNAQLVVRYLGYYAGVMTLFIGFAQILFDKRRQGVHDKIANTVVIAPKK